VTHLCSTGGAVAPPAARLSRQALDMQIARRHAPLADLEREMIAACEAAVHGTRARPNTGFQHKHRNRTAGRQYLAAAIRLEATYASRMRLLRREIGQLERLIILSIPA